MSTRFMMFRPSAACLVSTAARVNVPLLARLLRGPVPVAVAVPLDLTVEVDFIVLDRLIPPAAGGAAPADRMVLALEAGR